MKKIITAAILGLAVVTSGSAIAGSRDADRNLTPAQERVSDFGKYFGT